MSTSPERGAAAERLRELLVNLVLTHRHRIDIASVDHLRDRMVESIYVATNGHAALDFAWEGGTSSVPAERLRRAAPRTTIAGAGWKLTAALQKPDGDIDATLAEIRPIVDEFVVEMQSLRAAAREPKPKRQWRPRSATENFAEKMLARLRIKFTEGREDAPEPTQVLFGIYRADWQAVHLDRDIGDQLVARYDTLELRDSVRTRLEDQAVRNAVEYGVRRSCTPAEEENIHQLLDRIAAGEKIFRSAEMRAAFFRLWSALPLPKDPTMSWLALASKQPTVLWKPIPFPESPLQQLILDLELSFNLYAERPLVIVPVHLLGQPRMIVYLMACSDPASELQRTFWRGNWMADVMSAFQSELFAEIQLEILATPSTEPWRAVLRHLSLLCNFSWIGVRTGSGEMLSFSRRSPIPFVHELGEDDAPGDEQRRWLEEARRHVEPHLRPYGSDESLAFLPFGNDCCVIQLEQPEADLQEHLHALWQTVEDAIHVALRQRQQTHELLGFASHDSALLMVDFDRWAGVAGRLLKQPTETQDEIEQLRTAATAMIHVGHAPLQLWRDTILALVNGDVKQPAPIDIVAVLHWLAETNRRRVSEPVLFETSGIGEKAQLLGEGPERHLFNVVVYNLACDALRYGRDIRLTATADETMVHVTCSDTTAASSAGDLRKLERDLDRIRRSGGAGEQWLVRPGGFHTWAVMAQNALGAGGWNFNLEIEPHGEEVHVELVFGLRRPR